MRSERADRRLDILLYLASLIVVIILITGGLTIVFILSGNSNIEAVQDSGAITSCRAQYESLVTSASNEVQAAIATTFVDVLQPPEVRDLAKISDDTRLIQQSQKLYDAATDAYQAALRLATEDPDAFLQYCRDKPPS